MMRCLIATAVVILLMVSGLANAADMQKGCFQQDFSKAYLKKVENQFITSIQVEAGKGTMPSSKPTMAGTLRARFRDDKTVWWTGKFECVDGGASWSCIMDCDGGTFIMSRVKSGLQLVNQSFLRFGKTSCDPEPRDIKADVEHTVFTMPQISSGKCKP
jgi:hypothetical protein